MNSCPHSCWVVCVISKSKALSQGVPQPEDRNTKSKGFLKLMHLHLEGNRGYILSLFGDMQGKQQEEQDLVWVCIRLIRLVRGSGDDRAVYPPPSRRNSRRARQILLSVYDTR